MTGGYDHAGGNCHGTNDGKPCECEGRNDRTGIVLGQKIRALKAQVARLEAEQSAIRKALFNAGFCGDGNIAQMVERALKESHDKGAAEAAEYSRILNHAASLFPADYEGTVPEMVARLEADLLEERRDHWETAVELNYERDMFEVDKVARLQCALSAAIAEVATLRECLRSAELDGMRATAEAARLRGALQPFADRCADYERDNEQCGPYADEAPLELEGHSSRLKMRHLRDAVTALAHAAAGGKKDAPET